MHGTILFVDDDADQCELFEASLSQRGFTIRTTTSASAALDILAEGDVQVVVTDLGMDEMHGIALCERILCARPDAVVIVLTGRGDLESAVAAIRAGAFDYLTKPIDPKLLGLAVERAAKHHQISAEVQTLRKRAGAARPASLIGESAAMRRVYELLRRVCESDASVLIHGETGTGKELIAQAIHSMSGRAQRPFVAVNCAAVTQTLLESELFGHARGAFTDAKSAHQGLFVQANGGTLFLDEIGEMPIEMQPKLLRALQERVVRPVGDSIEIGFDARLVVATNRDLESEVEERRFREDLYYRINVVRIELPPLRDRKADIPTLANHFLARFAQPLGKHLSIPPQVLERLSSYEWPGNVRELENSMERAVALAQSDHISMDDLPERIRNYRSDRFVVEADDTADVVPVDELERRYVVRVLALVRGNKSRAAQLLGFDRRTLYRKLERYQPLARSDAGSGASIRS
jgi:DNA-binding NtrC family response regulator